MTNGFPWGGTQFPQVEWRAGMGEVHGEGAVADRTGTALVTAAGTDTEVDIRAHRAFVQGVEADMSATSIDVASFGSNPSSGQTRIDRICWKYDPTAKTITMTCVPGTPATTGSAVPPSLTRSTTGNWYVSIAKVTRVGTSAVLSSGVAREHAWLGPYLGSFSTSSSLPADAPQGSTAFVGTALYERVWDGAALTWQNLTDPPWLNIVPAINIDSSSMEARVVGGMIQMRGSGRNLNPPTYSTPLNFTTGGFTNVGLLPTDLPVLARRAPVTFLNADSTGILIVHTTGPMEVRPLSGVGNAAASNTVSLDGVSVPL